MTERSLVLLLVLAFAAGPVQGAVRKGRAGRSGLELIRKKILKEEKGLIASLKNREKARLRIRKLRNLQSLYREEREMSQARLNELRSVVDTLKGRESDLQKRLDEGRARIRKSLISLHKAHSDRQSAFPLKTVPALEAPRRKVLEKLVNWAVRDLEELRIDLADSGRLKEAIEKEQQQIAYLIQDLDQQRSLLEFHKRMQLHKLKRNYEEHLTRLEHYRNLRESEVKVGRLIKDFSARMELDKVNREEDEIARSMYSGSFMDNKGALPLPVQGRIAGRFGKKFDPVTRLSVFRKGIEIEARKGRDVSAIFAGRVVFAGSLPGYGKVTIIDHGAKHYSLCGNLGDLAKKTGEKVLVGEKLGSVGKENIYFEIRSGNVAVNPLQWVSDSIKIN